VKSFNSHQASQSTIQNALKRSFDCLLAGSGLIVSAPIWLAVSIAIVLEDGFPVFFRQERWGKGGRFFAALKFRSMWKGSEKERSVQAGDQDPRITRVGRFCARAQWMNSLSYGTFSTET
jgi:lipopolysaccharide/colanic/teichoic acid biosynthesis glycosyltransferase